MAKPPAALSLPKIDLTEKLLDVRLRLKGKPAVDLADDQAAYRATHGETVELEALVASFLALHLQADRGFQAWRRGRVVGFDRGQS